MSAVTARILPRLVFIAFASLCAAPTSLASQTPVSFRKDVAPILQRRCVACHGEESAKGNYRLDSFERLGKTGDSELPPLTAGKPEDSEMYRLMIEPDANDRMPQKAEALPAHEVALIERWIKEGAPNDGGAADRSLAALMRESMLLPAPEHYSRPVPVTALAYSPDGRQIAASGYYEVTIWDLDTGGLVRRIGGLPERITSLAWHPKTRLLAVAGGSPAQWGTVAVVDPAKDERPRFLCDLAEVALSVAWNPAGTELALGSGDRTVRFFDMPAGREKRVLRPHADWVQIVAYSPDGKHLLSASRDRTLRISETTHGEVETTYTGHETAILDAIYSRDGRTIVSVARDGFLHYWDAATGKAKSKPLSVPGHTERLAWVSLGLALGAADGAVRVVPSGFTDVLFTLHGHRDAISASATGPSQRDFATGSYDGTICIWDDFACGTWLRRFIASPR